MDRLQWDIGLVIIRHLIKIRVRVDNTYCKLTFGELSKSLINGLCVLVVVVVGGHNYSAVCSAIAVN